MNDEAKRNIRNRWIESIFELAHSEYQNRLWIEADYANSVGDFTECVCCIPSTLRDVVSTHFLNELFII